MKKALFFVLAIALCLSAGCSHAVVDEPIQVTEEPRQITVFLDAGHGKPSGEMTDKEKIEYGWVKNARGSYGEWRHWREGQYGIDCEENDGISKQPNDCWYPIYNGDRDIEPDINMQNCLSAKAYLEQMGYKVILSRDSNENPSITKRIDNAKSAGAELYICVHSNAGGGNGTAYISMSENNNYYALNTEDNAERAMKSNILGKMINDKIAENTSLDYYGSGCIDFEPYLILFQKAPMICAYLEIGFFDNEDNLTMLKNEYDQIGRSIAEGINEYCRIYMN